MRAIVPLGGALVGAVMIVTVLGLTTSAADPSGSTRRNVGLVRTAVTPDVSSNWAGYAAIGPGSTPATASPLTSFTDVTATWVQPAATCAAGASTAAAIWVGIGGYSLSSQKLEQVGTDLDCSADGKASYYVWYELVPADAVNVRLKIFPGDTITASVLITGSDVLVQVKDRTRRTSFTKHLPMIAPDLTSAEWIIEAPSECGATCHELDLTNFGSFKLTRTFATASTPSAGVQGGRILSPFWETMAIRLIPTARRSYGDASGVRASSTAGAVPVELAPDGGGFTANWVANAAAG
ncbi:MAG: G1 family glutamic endopeptidase [Actinomycetes bacterium]